MSAKKLVRAFSEAASKIIEQTPARLRDVAGSGRKRAVGRSEGDPPYRDLLARAWCRHAAG
jgi:hypothetical protein